MKRLIYFLFFSGISALLPAQVVDTIDVPVRQEIDIQSLPYYNFGKGVGLTSPDSLFQFNIRFRIQSRFDTNIPDDDEMNYSAMVRRLRLRFDGFVGDPRFLYVVQLSFAPGDVGPLEPQGDINIIRDAMVFYQPNKHWSFGFGQTKLPGNRQRVNSSGALQMTDRSINNAIFNIDRDFGFQGHYLANNPDNFSYNVKLALSTGEGRNFTRLQDNGLAYTGRLELFPLGTFTRGGEFFEGDLMREPTPKVYLGATLHHNQNAMRSAGQLGSLLYEQRDLNSLLIDGMLKYNGWSYMASYMQRTVGDPVTVDPLTGNTRYVYSGHGIDQQLSYITRNSWEMIGRYSYQNPSDAIKHLAPLHQQVSIGLTKYIWEHAFKAQLEVTRNFREYVEGLENNDWYIRFQIEMGI
ncbi:MAG: porin [Weeksellaceae bacterium]|nr:porin [Weeksellaceae bacterium]